MSLFWSAENGLGPGFLVLLALLVAAGVVMTRRSPRSSKVHQKLEIDRLIHQLQPGNESGQEAVRSELAQIGAPAVEPLLQAINTTGSVGAVIALCQILETLKDPAQYQRAMDSLNDSPDDLYLRSDFRQQVVRSLAEVGQPIRESLFTLIEERDGKGIFPCALKSLLEMEGITANPAALERLVKALIPALRDEDSGIRQSALGALDRLWHAVEDPNQQRRILAAVFRSLQDPSVWVRRNAVTLLEDIRATLRGDLPHVQIVYAMTAALGDEDAYVRRDAFKSLQKQRKWLPTLVRGGRSLKLIGALFDLLNDPDLKHDAALLLFEMGYPQPLDEWERRQEAQERFRGGTGTGDPSHGVRRGKAEIYRSLRTPAAPHSAESRPEFPPNSEDFLKRAAQEGREGGRQPLEPGEERKRSPRGRGE